MTPTRPYVISWNLTYRCNLACEHCYLDAGGRPKVDTPEFSDRRELSTEQCFSVIDQIAEFAPECVLILTGGEPLLRRDILAIVSRAAQKELWVVIGTNGVKVTETLAGRIKKEGVRGLALSLDALKPERHDAFRLVQGAWENTVQGAKILKQAELPFIIQTTVGKHNAGELAAIADFACEERHHTRPRPNIGRIPFGDRDGWINKPVRLCDRHNGSVQRLTVSGSFKKVVHHGSR